MKKFRVLWLAGLVAGLAACGGSGTGDQTPRVAFSRLVNFGDSLSDVGSYATKLVAANGGGHFSINGDLSKAGFPHTNWTEYVAAVLQLPAPCANEVGLDSVGDLAFMAQSPTVQAACFNYAQGGARVSDPHGLGNAYYYQVFGDPSSQIGFMTKPVTQQVSDFLAANTAFAADDLVTVLAGANDLLLSRALDVDVVVQSMIDAGLIGTDAGNQAIANASQKAVDDMALVAGQLADLVTGQIIANGATHVAVLNLPDVSLTPNAAAWATQGAGQFVEPLHPHLVLDMVQSFNAALASGLGVSGGISSHPEVAYVDVYAGIQAEFADPARYGLTETTGMACDLTKTGVTVPGVGLVPIPSALLCSKDTLLQDPAHITATDPTGVLDYFFSDDLHPTPLAHRLIESSVAQQLAVSGWL